MSTKTAYVWGPVSSFSASLLAAMLEKGWTIHLATKSALQISLSPLDLSSSAQQSVEKAVGTDRFKLLNERLVFLDNGDVQKGTTYDIALFMGLPSNFDEPRVSRAPWAAEELPAVCAKLKGVPVIIFSALSGGIQSDGTVPEEIEFERRKPRSHFEAVCQSYEAKILKATSKFDNKWHLVRIPLVLGSTIDGRSSNFTGLYNILHELYNAKIQLGDNPETKTLELHYDPNSTCWMLPNDVATTLVLSLIEDPQRPSICNVVSTQSTLCQEWMHELAVGLGVKAITPAEKDAVNLPGTLRAVLGDSIHVKTRNLFELQGRHQHVPVSLGSDYFAKVIDYANKHNWGQARANAPEPGFSAEHAREYFETFLPEKLDKKMMKDLASLTGGIAYQITGEEDSSFVVQAVDGNVVVSRFEPSNHKPAATFTIAANTFAKLVAGKISFEQALITRALQVSAGPLVMLKVCDLERKILRKFHFSNITKTEDSRVLEGALKE